MNYSGQSITELLVLNYFIGIFIDLSIAFHICDRVILE